MPGSQPRMRPLRCRRIVSVALWGCEPLVRPFEGAGAERLRDMGFQLNEAHLMALGLSDEPVLAMRKIADWLSEVETEVSVTWFGDVRDLAAVGVMLTQTECDLVSRPDLAGRMLDAGWRVLPTRQALLERVRPILSCPEREAAFRLASEILRVEELRINFAALRGWWSLEQAQAVRRTMMAVCTEAIQQWDDRHPGPPMGYPHEIVLVPELGDYRWRIRALYVQILQGAKTKRSERTRVADALGIHAGMGVKWIAAMADSDQLFGQLCESEESLHRMTTVLEAAPALVSELARSRPLTQAILSGEIEREGGGSLGQLPTDVPLAVLGETARHAYLRQILRWVIEPGFDLGAALTDQQDVLMRHVCGRLCAVFDLIALGSYGTGDMVPGATLEFLVFARQELDPAAEQLAMVETMVEALRRYGVDIALQFGEPPDGILAQRAEVRTYDEFLAHELDGMGLAERFRLGNARQIWGDDEAVAIVKKAATALPLTPERLRELVGQKRRAETELVQPQYRRRDVKRGWGGLDDIEWFVHLHEMRFPTATRAGATSHMGLRIGGLANARLINYLERDELLEARKHLLEVRQRLVLMGLNRDIIPENPDKLSRLAGVFGYADGNDFLAYHERVLDTVRVIYTDGLERLMA